MKTSVALPLPLLVLLATLNGTAHTAETVPPAEPYAPVLVSAEANSSPSAVDVGPFFIGNTIANLRGLDPVFPGRFLTLVDGRRTVNSRTPAAASNPGKTYTSTALPLPASWTAAPVSERRTCGAQGCSSSVDLMFHRADGSTRVFATRLTGKFIALPRAQRILACADPASGSEQASPSVVDLNGTRNMLPTHPGPLRLCASTGTGDEVLLVYSAEDSGKAHTLARVFDASGLLLAEGSFDKAGTLRFTAAGRRHAAAIPGP